MSIFEIVGVIVVVAAFIRALGWLETKLIGYDLGEKPTMQPKINDMARRVK